MQDEENKIEDEEFNKYAETLYDCDTPIRALKYEEEMEDEKPYESSKPKSDEDNTPITLRDVFMSHNEMERELLEKFMNTDPNKETRINPNTEKAYAIYVVISMVGFTIFTLILVLIMILRYGI